MRQGQQNNKRMRGRNRKGPNPLTRSYESNGPDVKIRGTAHHVAEKYLSLARDAQSSGDRVAAESYLQHAEHYFRIIAAAQQQQLAQQQPQAGGVPGQYVGSDDDEDDEPMQNDRFYSNIPPPPQFTQNNGQPYRGEQQNYNGGREQQNYNGNRDQQNYNGNRDQQAYTGNREQQSFNVNNGAEGGHRNNQQPMQQGEPQPSFDETGFGGEPPAFVAGGGQPNLAGGSEQAANGQPAGGEGPGYGRRRRRSGRDRQRFQDRAGQDGNPAPQPASSDAGGGSDE